VRHVSGQCWVAYIYSVERKTIDRNTTPRGCMLTAIHANAGAHPRRIAPSRKDRLAWGAADELGVNESVHPSACSPAADQPATATTGGCLPTALFLERVWSCVLDYVAVRATNTSASARSSYSAGLRSRRRVAGRVETSPKARRRSKDLPNLPAGVRARHEKRMFAPCPDSSIPTSTSLLTVQVWCRMTFSDRPRTTGQAVEDSKGRVTLYWTTIAGSEAIAGTSSPLHPSRRTISAQLKTIRSCFGKPGYQRARQFPIGVDMILATEFRIYRRKAAIDTVKGTEVSVDATWVKVMNGARIVARFARAEVDGWTAVEPKPEPKPRYWSALR
jgi:hypothetical protein